MTGITLGVMTSLLRVFRFYTEQKPMLIISPALVGLA